MAGTCDGFVHAAVRTAVGRFGGALAGVRPDDLAAVALTGVLAPVPGVDLARDEGIRPGASLESLDGLRPAFRADGTITAGNASPLNDGASAVLFGSAAAAERIGRSPLARAAGRAAFATEPRKCGIAPVQAAELALGRAGLAWSDVAAVEPNEAFAAPSLACVDDWAIDPEVVNAKGGAIAIGHPLGASGGRSLGTLAHRLRESGGRWGVAAICIGVGQALAVVLENLSRRLGGVAGGRSGLTDNVSEVRDRGR